MRILLFSIVLVFCRFEFQILRPAIKAVYSVFDSPKMAVFEIDTIRTVHAWIRSGDYERGEYLRAKIPDYRKRAPFYDFLESEIKRGRRGFLDDVLSDFLNR